MINFIKKKHAQRYEIYRMVKIYKIVFFKIKVYNTEEMI